ncbi:MAG: tRNA lysidine(34) synthetase TilS [Peptoniphilaceae bacterium]|nr:tRNA lysidine(34) synthetase TilS [Peptoniphilaceae bacterium]MDY6019053.1 tRNA lysidine(34) synthetase TilS [Anaerococcus sp.]
MFTKTEIINRLKNDIIDYKLISPKDTIIIGASGGPDSQFMIYALREVQAYFDFDIVLVHLNHLHRKDAIDDENLVIETAKTLGYTYFVERKSMDDFAKKEKLSPEDAGRRLRYDLFRRICKTYPKAKIAVGHNKDDQAETILMRIIRGTGLDGLKAMDYKSEDIIRPILSFSKKEILSYLDMENINYHIDSTNLQTDYTRNRIRLEIIPKIEEINPSFKDSLINLSLIAKDDLSIIESIENESFFNLLKTKDSKHLSLDRKAFENLDNPLRYRIIRKCVEELNKSLNNFSRLNIHNFASLVNMQSGKIIKKDNIIFQKNYKTYDFYTSDFFEKENDFSKEVKLYPKAQCDFGRYRIRTDIIDLKTYKNSKRNNREFFDYDKLEFPLLVRTRRAKDRFLAFDNGQTKKLKDFFIDQKIDRNIRDTIPIILSKDTIIWIAPFRRSNYAKIEANTKQILMIELEEV